MDVLYRINDVITALAAELGVTFASEEHEDTVLNDLTHEIAAQFGIGPNPYDEQPGEKGKVSE